MRGRCRSRSSSTSCAPLLLGLLAFSGVVDDVQPRCWSLRWLQRWPRRRSSGPACSRRPAGSSCLGSTSAPKPGPVRCCWGVRRGPAADPGDARRAGPRWTPAACWPQRCWCCCASSPHRNNVGSTPAGCSWRLPVRWSSSWVATRRDPAERLLEWAPLQWLGVRSYAIYLWSWPLQVLLEKTELATAGHAADRCGSLLLGEHLAASGRGPAATRQRLGAPPRPRRPAGSAKPRRWSSPWCSPRTRPS